MIVNERDNQPIFIGYVGENNSRPVPFYVGDIIEKYPDATFSLIHKRQGDEDGYPVNSAYWDVEEKILTWRPQSGDLAAEGIGELQIKASNDGDIIKTKVYKTDTHGALGESADPPSPWEGWLEQFEDEAAEAAEAAEDAADSAEDAEAYAIGKRGGTDVGDTDPAYQNNSKYYSEQAAGSATTAGSAASAAAESASAAQAAVNNFAPDYSELTFPIAEGTLCAHSGGYYVANQDISTSEEWTAAHWTATNIGTQLGAVKRALQVLEPSAAVGDVGKVPKVKTVADGKVTEYEFGSLPTVPSVATSAQIKAGTDNEHPVAPVRQHESAFYAFAKAAGDTTQESSSNAVGVYTETAKKKIMDMIEPQFRKIKEINIVEAVSKVYINTDLNDDQFSVKEMVVYIEDLVCSGSGALGIGVNIGQSIYKADGTFIYIGDACLTSAKTSIANLLCKGGMFFGNCSSGLIEPYTRTTLQTSKNAMGIMPCVNINEICIGSVNTHNLLSGKITIYGR